MSYNQINPFEAINNELSEIKNILLDLKNIPKEEKLPKHYSVQEVSKKIGCSNLSTYTYIKKGYIKASKIGRKYIISARDLEDTINLKEVKSLKYRR